MNPPPLFHDQDRICVVPPQSEVWQSARCTFLAPWNKLFCGSWACVVPIGTHSLVRSFVNKSHNPHLPIHRHSLPSLHCWLFSGSPEYPWNSPKVLAKRLLTFLLAFQNMPADSRSSGTTKPDKYRSKGKCLLVLIWVWQGFLWLFKMISKNLII